MKRSWLNGAWAILPLTLLGGVTVASQVRHSMTDDLFKNMTPVQRAHSSLYKEFSSGIRLFDGRPEVDPVSVFSWNDRGEAVAGGLALTATLSSEACVEDAAVRVHVLRGVSNPTEDGQYIFTDYDVLVEEALRLPAKVQMRDGSHTVLTRPGGHLKLGGIEYSAGSSDMSPLVDDRSYFVFARFLSVTGDFQVKTAFKTFEVRDSRVVAVGPAPSVKEASLADGVSEAIFRKALRSALANCK